VQLLQEVALVVAAPVQAALRDRQHLWRRVAVPGIHTP
jgi:hypothetical protein